MLNEKLEHFHMYGDLSCPGLGTHQICKSFNKSGMEMPSKVAYVSIISSLFSCIASILIVYSYIRWKDIRTGSRSVITFLAIADFCTAFGYIMGSFNYLIYYHDEQKDCSTGTFDDVCTIQSFITSWSSISSFFWTVALAFYLYLTLVHTKIFLANKLIPLFHVVNWGFPILVCLPLLLTWQLGYSPYAASTWCYIRKNNHPFASVGVILVAGKIWEILAYVLVIGLYAAIKCHIRKQTRLGEERNYLSSGLVAAVRKADSKLIFIPMVFVLLRMWGTIQFFYGFAVHPTREGCIRTDYYHGLVFLGVMQAIGDGGQGWGNFILYVLASGKIRNRLFGWMVDCLPCCNRGTAIASTDDHPKQNNGYTKVAVQNDQILSPYSSVNDGDGNNYGSIGMEPTTHSNSD